MQFAYYPGCSLKATGRAYDDSTRAVAEVLGIDLQELEDWNCCGATSYMSVRELLSTCISARNLSLAQQQGLDIVAPCSACFTVLRKTDHRLHDLPDLRKKVAEVLKAANLSYEPGSVRVLHLVEIFLMNKGLAQIRDLVSTPLKGLRVAPYYGCQVVRPVVEFDHAELPTSMDDIMAALGAEVVYYPMKARCCGASLMASNESAAYRLCKNLLLCAQQNGAQCIVTLCPLCQMNLDAFQNEINERYGTHFRIPVLYFTQLMGLGMGLSPASLGFGREIEDASELVARFSKVSSVAPMPGASA